MGAGIGVIICSPPFLGPIRYLDRSGSNYLFDLFLASRLFVLSFVSPVPDGNFSAFRG